MNVRPFVGITHTNRADLLDKAVMSVIGKMDIILVDNSEEGYFCPPQKWGNLEKSHIKIIRPHQPMTYTQSMNYFRKICIEGDIDYFFYLHEDAELSVDSIERMTRIIDTTEDNYWGVILTRAGDIVTDAFSAYSLKLMKKQKWDTVYPAYFGDTDYFYWAKKREYSVIESDIQIKHFNSATIHSDERLEFKNSVTYPLYKMYFEQKTGSGYSYNNIPFENEIFDWKDYKNS